MHHKAIKAQIRKQLKTRYLNWHRLTKKEKKADKGHEDHSPYIGMDNKQSRAFIGLSLNRKQMLSHVQLCQRH